MQKKTQFTVMLANEPGELARVAKLVAKAKVNIEALTINDGVHHGVLKFVVDGAGGVRKAFTKARLTFSEHKVYAVTLPNQPGALAEMCGKLAAKGVNIDYVYGSTCACDEECCRGDCTLILSGSDEKTLKAALK
jgi:hypothetical protein